MARIMRNCEMHQKSFPIKEYKSWKAAEEAGRVWIAEQKKILPPSRMNEEGRMTKRNKSGVVGVCLARSIRRKPNRKKYIYWRWIARWPDCPSKGGFMWTISEETPDDDAFALACLSREMRSVEREEVRKKLSKIYGTKKHAEIMEKKMLQLV
jgi:hypothetical protein